MLLESVHAHIYLVDLVAGAISEDTPRDEQSTILFGIDEGRALCQFLTFDSYSTFCVLEGLVEVHCMVLNFDELVLMWLNSELDFNVLLKFLSAVDLVENKFVVEGFNDNLLEFLSKWLEILFYLEHISLAINNVHKFGVQDLLLHLLVDRLYFLMFFLELFLLLYNLSHYLLLVLLFLVVLLPELPLNSLHLFAGQFKKLSRLYGLLLI